MFLYYYFQCCPTTMLLCILEKCLWTVSFHINPLHLFFVSDAFLSLSLSFPPPFFSCFPTSTLKFPPSRSVITILICRRILFVPFPPLLLFLFFLLLVHLRAYSQDVEWVSEGHSSPRSSNFLGQFRLSPSRTTDARNKSSQALFLRVLTWTHLRSLLLSSSSSFSFFSLSFSNPPIDFPRDWWSSQPTLIYFSLPSPIEKSMKSFHRRGKISRMKRVTKTGKQSFPSAVPSYDSLKKRNNNRGIRIIHHRPPMKNSFRVSETIFCKIL